MSLAKTAIGTPFLPALVNRCPDPSMEAFLGASGGNNSATNTFAQDLTTFRPGTGGKSSMKLTRTATTPNSTFAAFYWGAPNLNSANTIHVVPGEVISWSMYVMAPYEGWKATPAGIYRDSAGTSLGGVPSGAQTGPLPANVWNLVKYENIVMPANCTNFAPSVSGVLPSGITVGGETCWADDCIVVGGPTVPPYFDGRQPNAAWTGLPDSSVAVSPPFRSPIQINRLWDYGMESGVSNAQISNNNSMYPIVYDTAIKHSGTRSIRADRTTTSPSATIASISITGPGTPLTSSNRLWVVPGETISIGGWVRVSVSAWRASWNITWRDLSNAVVGSTQLGPILTQSVGANVWAWVVWEGVVVPAAPAAMATLYMTAFLPAGQTTVGGEQAWLDDVTVCSGSSAVPSDLTAWRPLTVPGRSNQVRAIGPWSRWDGSLERTLDLAGLWDGTALQPLAPATVEVV